MPHHRADNAVRHTPDRAEIRIRRVIDETGGHFSVTDTGEGIPVRLGETAVALYVKLQLDKAAARAEVVIRASCYCRRKAVA